MKKRITYCPARGADVNKESLCPDKDCTSCDDRLTAPPARKDKTAGRSKTPMQKHLPKVKGPKKKPVIVLNFPLVKNKDGTIKNEDAVTKIFDHLRERGLSSNPNPLKSPSSIKPLKTTEEKVAFILGQCIEPDELIRRCKTDPDFIFSEQGTFNIRLYRADLLGKDRKTSARARRTLEAIGKCLALKRFREKPAKIDKAVLIKERDDFAGTLPNTLSVPEKKQRANYEMYKKYKYDTATIERYEKDIEVIDLGGGKRAYYKK